MPQAQKLFSKTLLYPTDTEECSNEGLIPTENSFCFTAENKSHSPAPGHGCPGARVMVRMAWGMCGPVLGEQRLAVMGREAPPLGWAWMRGSWGPQGNRGAPAPPASAPTLAPKPLVAVGFGFLVISRRSFLSWMHNQFFW